MFEMFFSICLAKAVDLECGTFRLNMLAPSSEECFLMIDEHLENNRSLIEANLGKFFVVEKSCVPVQGA